MASFTQISIGPSSRSTRSAAAYTASASATSTGSTSALPPKDSTSRAAASRPSRPRAIRPRSAPCRANSRTAARPAPAEAPVMTTISRFFILSPLGDGCAMGALVLLPDPGLKIETWRTRCSTSHGLQVSGEVAKKRSLVGEAHAADVFAMGPDVEDHFDNVIDVALGVDAARNREADKVHLCGRGEHQGSNFHRAHAALEI